MSRLFKKQWEDHGRKRLEQKESTPLPAFSTAPCSQGLPLCDSWVLVQKLLHGQASCARDNGNGSRKEHGGCGKEEEVVCVSVLGALCTFVSQSTLNKGRQVQPHIQSSSKIVVLLLAYFLQMFLHWNQIILFIFFKGFYKQIHQIYRVKPFLLLSSICSSLLDTNFGYLST